MQTSQPTEDTSTSSLNSPSEDSISQRRHTEKVAEPGLETRERRRLAKVVRVAMKANLGQRQCM